MSPAELELLSKSICVIEKIKNIQQQGGDDYSENSYRRGRSRTTGRFVSRDSGNSSRRYYDSSGYSGHSIKDRMVAGLEEMFDEAQSEHEKQVVQDWINRLASDF